MGQKFGQKRKRGQKGAWRDDFPERAYRLALLGFTDQEMAFVFGVEPNTLYYWKRTKPEFKEAILRGRAEADAKVGERLFDRAVGFTKDEEKIHVTKDGEVIRVPVKKFYPPSVTAQIFWLKNRQPHHWRDVQKHELSGPNGGPIPINSNVHIDLSDFSDEELALAEKMGLRMKPLSPEEAGE